MTSKIPIRLIESHPQQRPLINRYVGRIVENEWGSSLDSILSSDQKHAIHVVLEPHGNETSMITLQAIQDIINHDEVNVPYYFYVFSGQHRVEVLKRRLILDNPEKNEDDVMHLPQAKWLAMVFKPGPVDYLILCIYCSFTSLNRSCS